MQSKIDDAAAARARLYALYHRRKAAGQCRKCGLDNTPGICSRCAREHDERNHKRHAARVAAKQCVDCSAPMTEFVYEPLGIALVRCGDCRFAAKVLRAGEYKTRRSA